MVVRAPPFAERDRREHDQPIRPGAIRRCRFTVDVTIPAGLANGNHSLVASGVDFNGNAYVMRSDFTVGAAGAQSAKLPYTGASIALPLIGGLAAVGVGGGLLVSARRRKNA
jgi:LPXTG-motif cell wall-anchored protein